MKKLFFGIVVVFVFACSAKISPSGTKLVIQGAPSKFATRGIFDASLAADPSQSRIWMSYSATDSSRRWPVQNPVVVSTHLAYSDDSGKTWNYSGLVNAVNDVKLDHMGNLGTAGSWQSEVSSIVFDPNPADPSQAWKITWMHYLWLNGLPDFGNLWFGLKMASTPEGLETAKEIKFFVGTGYNSGADDPNSGNGTPLAGPPAFSMNKIDPAVDDCVFAEPSFYATTKNLYLGLGCVHAQDQAHESIVLFSCKSPCQMTDKSGWSYLGEALSFQDGNRVGGTHGFEAPEIRESNGSVYLFATPDVGGYRGCRVYKFQDLDHALLQRTNGVPDEILEVNGVKDTHSGACTYLSSATGSGVIYEQANAGDFDFFQLYMSGTKLP